MGFVVDGQDMDCTNLILIGMPAAGKSTIGRRLAQHLDWAFVDTDLLMEAWWGAPLQRIRDHLGLADFVRAEAEQVLRVHLRRCVIATGGSVVYSEQAMDHLRGQGRIVWLSSSYTTIASRLTNPESRGLAMGPGQTLRDLYDERMPLYARYADQTVNTDGAAPDAICSVIIHEFCPDPQDPS